MGTVCHRDTRSSHRQTEAKQFCYALLAQITSVAMHYIAFLSTSSEMMQSRCTCYFLEDYFGHE